MNTPRQTDTRRMPPVNRFLTRGEIRRLKRQCRQGDAQAAMALLDHSVRCGHRRLALRRFFVAWDLGARNAFEHLHYCKRVSRSYAPEEIDRIRRQAREDLQTRIGKVRDVIQCNPAR